MSFFFIGGQGLKEPVNRLQNALSFNYYANTEVYDERSVVTEQRDELNQEIWESIASDYDLSFLETLSFHEISLDDALNGAKDLLSNAFIGRIIIKIGECRVEYLS